MLSMILALDKNKLIGDSHSSNGLPWHYSEDLQYYKKNTIHKKNVMGRKTFEQIGKPLPNRETYILTRNKDYTIANAKIIHQISDIIELDKNTNEEIMITGGVELFKELSDKVERIYLTKIDYAHEGDVYFENFSTEGYELISKVKGENPLLTFEIWERKK